MTNHPLRAATDPVWRAIWRPIEELDPLEEVVLYFPAVKKLDEMRRVGRLRDYPFREPTKFLRMPPVIE